MVDTLRQGHGDTITALSAWLNSPVGRYVLAWEQAQFDALVTDIFGFHAVQIGLPELPALRANRMPLIVLANEPYTQKSATDGAPQLLVRPEALPFASQSIDLLVLPHILEFAEDPHQVLREAERVLIPEGQVIIAGFNPFSLWGLRQTCGRTFDAPFLPLAGQFLALPRLKDWLKLLSFEVNRGRFGCYAPPFRSEKWLNRCRFMEKSGDRWWPFCGAVYMISAVKRVSGMMLVGPAWKERKAAGRLAPVANSGAHSGKGCLHG